jgi:hypothetical protein
LRVIHEATLKTAPAVGKSIPEPLKTKPFVVSRLPAVYMSGNRIMNGPTRILYCNCTYAQVVPKEVKEAVLKKLCESDLPFEAVADLCEMSARQAPVLKHLAEGGAIKVAACYPRAVKWLFAAAKAPLPPDNTEVLNMRIHNADEIAAALFNPELKPNLPAGKVTASDAPTPVPG